jgi:hypothetical protein
MKEEPIDGKEREAKETIAGENDVPDVISM